jgi:CO/xanthine dehydrogenase FAD-binding subunit
MAAHDARARLGDLGAFVGGGTALQLGWGDRAPSLTFVSVADLPQAQGVQLVAGPRSTQTLRVGAGMRLEALRGHPLVRRHAVLLSRACDEVGALAVRHLATLGGNVGWGCGDTLAPLLALQAHAELATGGLQTLHQLLELPEMPLIVALLLPAGPLPGAAFYEKLGHRQAFTATRLALSGVWTLDPQGAPAQVQLACCGAGLRARRLSHAQDLLSGGGSGAVPVAELERACALDLPAGSALARVAARLIAGRLRGSLRP